MTRLPDSQIAWARRRRACSLFLSLPLERVPVLARNDREESLHSPLPLSELAFRPCAAGVMCVLLHQMAQALALTELSHVHEIDQYFVALLLELTEFVEHECDPAAHSRTEVAADASEHDDRAARHVLAAVVADSFHHRDRATVAHRESLARHSSEIRFARRCTVKNGVAHENRLVGDELRGARVPDDQASARRSLAHVVVRLALALERKTARRKSAEALTRRAGEAKRDGI